MKFKIEDIINEPFKDSGVVNVNIDKVIEIWDNFFSITEWRGSRYRGKDYFRIIILFRKYPQLKEFSLNIPEKQAKEIIKKLNLKPHQSPIFKSSITWRIY